MVECESNPGELNIQEDGEEYLEQACVVTVDRLNCVNDGDNVRLLTDDEALVLKRLQEVFTVKTSMRFLR